MAKQPTKTSKAGSGVALPNRLVTKAVAATPGSTQDNGQVVTRDNRTAVNEAYSVVRNRNDLVASMRDATARDGTFSSAVYSTAEVAMSGGYRYKAYNTVTHEFDLLGSLMARSIISRIDSVYDYTKGFADKMSFDMLLEQSLLEVIHTGALGVELVLTKERFPDRLNVIAYETLDWVSRGKKGGRYPRQTGQGDPIPLDIPTFFVSESHRHAIRAYTDSMMAAGTQAAQQFSEFVQEMRRNVRRNAVPRLKALLDVASVQDSLSEEVKSDPSKLKAAMDAKLAEIKLILDGLNPEDALVAYDLVKFELMQAEGEKSDYVTMLNALSGQLATSLKSSPSILGLRINGSQSLSNTESLIFLKVANSIRRPVQEVMSRAITLAVRLLGYDVYVEFEFCPINLRPDDELEAFFSMKQKRIFELVSEGFMSEDEASWDLTFAPRPPGAPKLFGTGFTRSGGGIDASKASPNSDPMGRALQSDQPSSAGGSDNA